jgi:hypothetical protein
MSGYPVNHLAIYYNSDHFWHYHIPCHEATIVYRLLRRNQPVFFLHRYTLLGTTLTLEFGKLCANNRLPADDLEAFRLVHVNGTEFCLNILDPTDNPPWNITQHDRDISLLDPEGDFFIPP